MSDGEFEERFSQKGFEDYIPMFEERRRRPFNPDIYEEEYEKINH